MQQQLQLMQQPPKETKRSSCAVKKKTNDLNQELATDEGGKGERAMGGRTEDTAAAHGRSGADGAADEGDGDG